MTNKEFCKSEVVELSRMLAVCRVAIASTCLLMCAFLHSAIPKANAQDAGLGQSRVKIEADVSTRRIAVTSGFSGSEIIVFGTIVNAIPSDDEPYDVIIIMDGISQHLVTRRKSNVVGLWINTSSVKFGNVPSYYAIASTRPISQIASNEVLNRTGIGFDYVANKIMPHQKSELATDQLQSYRSAILRIKQNDNLYQRQETGVHFIGDNLFRSSVRLPANIPVGQLKARVYLFQSGKLLAQHESNVGMQLEGVERYIHAFAVEQPFLYGIFAVLIAAFAGLMASAVFPSRH